MYKALIALAFLACSAGTAAAQTAANAETHVIYDCVKVGDVVPKCDQWTYDPGVEKTRASAQQANQVETERKLREAEQARMDAEWQATSAKALAAAAERRAQAAEAKPQPAPAAYVPPQQSAVYRGQTYASRDGTCSAGYWLDTSPTQPYPGGCILGTPPADARNASASGSVQSGTRVYLGINVNMYPYYYARRR